MDDFSRPLVLTIAGHDPSSGAGLNADLKTFEQFETYGLSVCTSVTVQNDDQFESVEWMSESLLLQQIDVLARKFQPLAAKIGLIENLDVLSVVLNRLHHHWPSIRIVWDPVLSASAGFVFHQDQSPDRFQEIMKHLFVVTPNEMEFQKWFSHWDHHKPTIYRKGGHQEGEQAVDQIRIGKTVIDLSAERLDTQKHGSGCILSAGIAAGLALGLDLTAACMRAKAYTRTVLLSNQSLLGYHAYIK